LNDESKTKKDKHDYNSGVSSMNEAQLMLVFGYALGFVAGVCLVWGLRLIFRK